jgi:hypothetical protein
MPIEKPALPGCVPSGKLITYGKGKAPTLNYQVPQKTSFTTYGDIGLGLPADWFTANAQVVPPEVTAYTSQTVEEIAATLRAQNAFPSKNKNPILSNLATQSTAPVAAATEFMNSESVVEGVQENFAAALTPAAQDVYINQLAQLLKDGNAIEVVETFGGFGTEVIVVKRPQFPNARLFIIEEYKTTSFLGDYGAGETIKTFSLLPGEKTTITVKTFKEITSTSSRAENLMDSFSQNSAREFEKTLQSERQVQSQISTALNYSIGASIGMSIKLANVKAVQNTSLSASVARAANTNSLSKSLDKHTDSTNASREMSVNTTTNDSFKESVEESTVRELVNPNVSRVLNFVFRQLLQEYVSVTYLSDIKVAFTNGHPESFVVLPIEELDELLNKFIVDNKRSLVRDKIRNEYATIEGLSNPAVTFLETKTKKNFLGVDTPFMTKKKGLTDSFTKTNMDGDAVIYPVNGVVLKADINTLRTDSFIVDALLGQGEALDCFNSHVQEAKMQALYLDNEHKELENKRIRHEAEKMAYQSNAESARLTQEFNRRKLELDTLATLVGNPALFAEAYAKMFNPQQNVINT